MQMSCTPFSPPIISSRTATCNSAIVGVLVCDFGAQRRRQLSFGFSTLYADRFRLDRSRRSCYRQDVVEFDYQVTAVILTRRSSALQFLLLRGSRRPRASVCDDAE